MESTQNFSDELILFLKDIWGKAIFIEMPLKLNKELFNECFTYVIENNGFPSAGFMLKGWSFGNALFNLLHNDQQIIIYKEALRVNGKDSKTWKLLGVEYFKLSMYRQAIFCLKKALNIGLDANPNATYEVLGSCYAFENNREDAELWMCKSTRVDINFIYRTYGSIENYAQKAFKKKVSLSNNYAEKELELDNLG